MLISTTPLLFNNNKKTMKKRYVAPQSKYYHFVLEGFLANSQNLGIHEDRADEGFVELSHKLEGIWEEEETSW